MKKSIIVILLVILPLLLTACGKEEETTKKSYEKKIVCTKISDNMDMNIKFVYNTKKKEFKSGSFVTTFDLSDYSDSERERIKENKDQLCEIVEDSAYFFKNCKVTVSSKKLKTTADLDLDKINATYEDVEEQEDLIDGLENILATECKIK